jgi:hypothetical protein
MATKNPIVDPMIDPRTGEYAVIAPGHNFKSVTQKIAGIVLTSNTPLGWFFGLVVGGGVAMGVVIGDHPRRMGIRHHQLRVVDRYRPRGNPYLGDPSALQADLA